MGTWNAQTDLNAVKDTVVQGTKKVCCDHPSSASSSSSSSWFSSHVLLLTSLLFGANPAGEHGH
jgi:hypothetical protein